MAVSSVNIVITIISLIAAVIYSGQSAVFTQKLNEIFHWKTGCNPIYAVGNVSLHYFSGRGRAEAIRILMEDQLIHYTETHYSKDTWPESQLAGVATGVFTFGKVPAIVTSKNKHLVQRNVILHYLGRSVGLDCDCRDLEKCDVIASGVDDLYQIQSRVIHSSNFEEMRNDYVTNFLVTWFSYFEHLVPSNGVYFASERLTWVDYLVFEMLESNFNFIDFTRANENDEDLEQKVLFNKFPRLRNFYRYFQNRPNIMSYINSTKRFPYMISKEFA